MYGYLIKSYCDCGSPTCGIPTPKSTMMILMMDPTEEKDNEGSEALLKVIEKYLDPPDCETGQGLLLEVEVNGIVTEELTHAVQGALGLACAACGLLKELKKEEKEEFTEDALENVDLNI